MNVHRQVRANVGCAPLAAFFAVTLAALSIIPTAADAHHSPAAFDTRKTMTISGMVKKYEWFNPHVYVTIEQTRDDGTKVEWEIECVAPAMMTRLGWTRETLRIGDVLTVTGSPGRHANSKGFLAGSIKRADSMLLDPSDFAKKFSPANQPKFAAKDLAGTWLALPSVLLIVQNSLPNAANLTGEGAQILKDFDEKNMSPAAQCLPSTAPGSMVQPDKKHIAVGDGVLVLRNELDSGVRTIHLNATHDGAIASHQGHSIGTWEGQTLVVDTTHFAYHASGNGIGVPSSTKKHLIERFTLSADGTNLSYRFEAHDPQYLKVPRTGEFKWTFRPDMTFTSEPCNLDSARRFRKH